ncbi:helix-turn-helix domain-containing protein [Shewanella japonica]|uniref:helix-turn-helix domain-containing protein n=1 Tax=Shewanella japonica TaxID=93973 RepID=UPI000E7521B5|nr:helix-turn-helix domain-containing protein [Shewanella japonica]
MKKPIVNFKLTSTDNMIFFTQVLERKGVPWKHIAEKLRLPTNLYDYEQWIPLEVFSLFIDKMTPKIGEAFGVEVGKSTHSVLIDKHLICVFDESPSVEKLAVEVMTRSHQITRHVDYWLEKKQGRWFLCNKGRVRSSYPGYAQIEWFRVSMLIELFRNVLGSHWCPETILMMTSAHLGQESKKHFHKANVEFDCLYSAIDLPISADFIPFPVLAKRINLLTEVTLLASTYAHLPNFGIEWASSLIGVSRKTLQRHLSRHNTHFREIREQARENTAIELLTASTLPIEDIAYRLGYSDLANFSRGFYKRVGFRPAEYRKRCAENPF